MIQVDGLSRRELERALAHGRMPFLRRLRDRFAYRVHALYSGLPSSTPAVQAELFYGVKGAVPAFGFRDADTGQRVTMLDRAATARVERGLARRGVPLLTGGAAYCDIFAGGASESHFCPATLEAATLLPAKGQLTFARNLLAHLRGFFHAAVLGSLELTLAFADCARGIAAGQPPSQELLFVPSRVAVCVILRELCAEGVAMDLERGLPVVHVNLPGYDEQAHRRGPASAFARWSLGGIDRTVERLWNAARRSTTRDYEVWVYSDHGQESTRPFEKVTGRSLAGTLSLVLDDAGGTTSFDYCAKGPLGHVYLAEPLPAERREIVAERLVSLGIPLVLARAGPGTARAWNARGAFDLPGAATEVLGADHPFLHEVAADLTKLCHHACAGDFVISGHATDAPQLTFPSENGSHGGPGAAETSAFALLPAGQPGPQRGWLRPLDLRERALAIRTAEADPVDPVACAS